MHLFIYIYAKMDKWDMSHLRLGFSCIMVYIYRKAMTPNHVNVVFYLGASWWNLNCLFIGGSNRILLWQSAMPCNLCKQGTWKENRLNYTMKIISYIIPLCTNIFLILQILLSTIISIFYIWHLNIYNKYYYDDRNFRKGIEW